VLPRILVRASDWTGQSADTTPENVVALKKEFEQSLTANKNVIERPQAMLLGGEPWVRYVDEAQLEGKKAERQILQRVVGGKLYTVELQIFVRKILESRDQAYAVAAGLKFKPAAAAAPGESAAPGSTEPSTGADPAGPSSKAPPAAENPVTPQP
jgi:hypothetical protein